LEVKYSAVEEEMWIMNWQGCGRKGSYVISSYYFSDEEN
jgi:hypothetical protein